MSKLDELDKAKEIIKRNLPSAYHKENGEPCDFLPVKEIEKIASEACELGKLEEREANNSRTSDLLDEIKDYARDNGIKSIVEYIELMQGNNNQK